MVNRLWSYNGQIFAIEIALIQLSDQKRECPTTRKLVFGYFNHFTVVILF